MRFLYLGIISLRRYNFLAGCERRGKREIDLELFWQFGKTPVAMFDVSFDEQVRALSARSALLDPFSSVVVELVAAVGGGRGGGVVDTF